MYLKALTSAANEMGVEGDDQAWQKLLAYLALLQKWNKVYNLTAIRDPKEMLVKHVYDSISVAPYVDSETLLDVGTGGGMPGIPLAILYPNRRIGLLDSNQKKTRFLTQVKAELGLQNVEVFHTRVELFQPEVPYEGIISRAFASAKDMVSLTEHLLATGGAWWAMKSQKTQEELAELPAFAKMTQVWELDVPGLDASRTLVRLTKTQ